jgi:multiple sugar transport system ATP-binding protein
MRAQISALHKKLATTFVYVTHDQTEAMTMGDRICVMRGGYIQQFDTPQNLYNYPCNMFVAGFIGSPQMNFMDAKVTQGGNVVEVGGFQLQLSKDRAAKLKAYDGKSIVLGIRPEDVHDEADFLAKHPEAVINAEIKVYELLGAEVFLYFDFAGSQMTARVNPRTTARTGDTVKFALDMEKAHFFDKETEKTITD